MKSCCLFGVFMATAIFLPSHGFLMGRRGAYFGPVHKGVYKLKTWTQMSHLTIWFSLFSHFKSFVFESL